MAPCLLLQTVPEVKATGAYDWSKASRAMDKKPGAFLNNAKRWPGCGRTSGMRCVIARAAPARDGVFLRLYGRRMLPEPAFSLNEKGACQPVKRQVITQSGAAQGLAVLAPLRGSFTSFLCLTEGRSPNGSSARRQSRRYRVSGARTARQQQRCSGPHSGTLAQKKSCHV